MIWDPPSLPSCIVDGTCDGKTDLYISNQGRNIPGCGTKLKPCHNLTDALTEYHLQTNNTWLSCVKINMDHSQILDGLDKTGLEGLGNPSLEYGNHTLVQVVHSGAEMNNNVSLVVYGVQFYHVIIKIKRINLELEGCKLEDSSLSLDEAESLSVTQTDWTIITL